MLCFVHTLRRTRFVPVGFCAKCMRYLTKINTFLYPFQFNSNGILSGYYLQVTLSINQFWKCVFILLLLQVFKSFLVLLTPGSLQTPTRPRAIVVGMQKNCFIFSSSCVKRVGGILFVYLYTYIFRCCAHAQFNFEVNIVDYESMTLCHIKKVISPAFSFP